MGGNWKIWTVAHRNLVLEALESQEQIPEWDAGITIAGSEAGPADPGKWMFEAWLPRKPRGTDFAAIRALFGNAAPDLAAEQIPAADWVTESQRGIEPVRAGRFHVHTPDCPPIEDPGVVDFTIPAGQAFGTGQHETTSGCLAMLDAMKRRGVVVRNCADIGTGTGLLAFAALALWPAARATATDIDPVCASVVAENAAANGVAPGHRPGEVLTVIADGLDHDLIQACLPFDLIIANILAGPLIELAPDFSAALAPKGHLLLAGLLTSQEDRVRAACMRAGLRLAARLTRGEWSILWLRRRAAR